MPKGEHEEMVQSECQPPPQKKRQLPDVSPHDIKTLTPHHLCENPSGLGTGTEEVRAERVGLSSGVTGPQYDQDQSTITLFGHAVVLKILRSCSGPETPGRSGLKLQ